MQVKDVMSKNVEVIDAGDTLRDAAERMRRRDIGVLPVQEDGRAIGMVTDRDITIRGVAAGKDPRSCTVREVMTPDVAWVDAGQDVTEAAKLMEDRQIRRALVVGEQNTIAGILSLGDLATHLQDQPLPGEVLNRVSQPR